jgi:hypothetical protein
VTHADVGRVVHEAVVEANSMNRVRTFSGDGTEFFCTSLEQPMGSLDLLREAMQAMHMEGTCHSLGKLLFSAGEDYIAILVYVPSEQIQISCTSLLQVVLDTHDDVLELDLSEGTIWSGIVCRGRVKIPTRHTNPRSMMTRMAKTAEEWLWMKWQVKLVSQQFETMVT